MADKWQLQDGSGSWQLQDASGYWILQADAAAALDDGSDSWWSSSQHGFVSVPLAGAAAALSLAVAISGSLQYNDDFVPRKMASQSDTMQVVSIGGDLPPTVFDYNDDILPQAAVPALEESGWTFTQPPLAPIAAQPPTEQDDLPTRIDEVYEWTQPYSVPALVVQSFAADEEIVPQPAAAAPPEEYEWAQPYSAQALVIPQPTWADDDLVPQPVVFTPVEDYWYQSPSYPNEPAAHLWPQTEELPRVVAQEDDSWQVYTPPLAAARVFEWQTGDEVVTAPAALVFEDDSWQVYTPPLAAAKPMLWFAEDERQTPPTPLPFDEEPWQVYTPPYPQPWSALPLAWGEEDTIATGIPAIPDSPLYFALVPPPELPTPPAYERMPRDPQVDKDFFALARMSATNEYLEEVVQWMADELGAGEVKVEVFGDDDLKPDADLFGEDL